LHKLYETEKQINILNYINKIFFGRRFPYYLKKIISIVQSNAVLYFDFTIRLLQKGIENDLFDTFYQFHTAQIYLHGVRNYEKNKKYSE